MSVCLLVKGASPHFHIVSLGQEVRTMRTQTAIQWPANVFTFLTLCNRVGIKVLTWVVFFAIYKQQNPYLGNDASLSLFLLAHHSIGFASTSLSISKYTNIVALKGMFQHFLSNVIVDAVLGCKGRIFRLWETQILDTYLLLAQESIELNMCICANICAKKKKKKKNVSPWQTQVVIIVISSSLYWRTLKKKKKNTCRRVLNHNPQHHYLISISV